LFIVSLEDDVAHLHAVAQLITLARSDGPP
jgi:hypothetical protein